MLKKYIPAMIAAVAGFVIFTFNTYAVGDDITTREIQSPNTAANRESIARKILDATGRQDQFDPSEAQLVTIYYGNVDGEGRPEAVIALQFSPKNTIVAVYSPTEDGYTYVGDLGEFYDVRTIEFMPIRSLGRSAVIIREDANQNIGAFEESSFVRGYLYDNGTFREVLSIPESIKASWNDLWTNDGQSNIRWQRITQNTDASWTDVNFPVLDMVYYQAHSISSNTEDKNIPEDSTFTPIKERVETEQFYWSDAWRRFILSEKIDNQSGQTVAVIEDFGVSPYALLEEYGDNSEKMRIERQDGSQEIVYKNTLSDLPE